MSVRVRCRCGQELQLRYGEWVYAFLGLVVLCLALNSLALLLIFFHLERMAERMESAAGVESASAGSGSAVERSDTGSEPATSKPTARKKRNAGNGALKRAEGTVSPPAETPTQRDPPPTSGSSSAESGRSSRESVRAGGQPVNSSEEPRADLVPVAEAREHATGRGGESSAVNRGTSKPGAADVDTPSNAWVGLFAGEAPLVRLLLLEQAPGGLDWRLGFLLDEDRRLRQRALERLRSYRARVTANQESFSSPRAREWLRVVRGSVEGRPDGRSLLGELAALFPYASDSGAAGRPIPFSDLLAATSKTGETFLQQPPVRSATESARRIARVGLDCVLLLDVSQSMENVLVPARREIARLWPILNWGLPGIRLGVVFYHDEVVDVLDFSMEIDEQLARLDEVEASGGGDVPESLHLAIKKSLRLGVFDWRPDALKHLIVLGDAPPPYADQRGLASLVRQARQQAGFRVHALGLNPEEGRESVPFFAELAKAGGGRARTIDPTKTGNEVALCLQPGISVDLLEPLLAVADRLLSS